MEQANQDLFTHEFEAELKRHIRDVIDFPQKGIVFKDITNLLRNGRVFNSVVDRIVDAFREKSIDIVCAVEARGFILGAAVAHGLGAGFIPIRKPGKLPWDIHQQSYELEYGEDTLEIHIDAINAGNHVLFVDDVLATGGTAKASVDLIGHMNGNLVSAVFLIELLSLNGREKLGSVPSYSLIRY